MRKELQSLDGQRLRFRATVERFGKKTNWNGYPEPTILFKDVRRADTGQIMTDHIWFVARKTITALNLQPGDTVEFEARVGEYIKGFVSRRDYIDERTVDYKLNRPTKFKKIVEVE